MTELHMHTHISNIHDQDIKIKLNSHMIVFMIFDATELVTGIGSYEFEQ